MDITEKLISSAICNGREKQAAGHYTTAQMDRISKIPPGLLDRSPFFGGTNHTSFV
ncbi:hypothetical protein [Halobacillus karajensis]|uniref:hypothetical protein n=1 Tax=Halobacillus karajensis TaxID=195088 RepID=UPI0014289857|nr:hypothetical protein [Halobacillus karajensis]